MIDKKDLRIGNWVMAPIGSCYNTSPLVQVKTIGSEGINEMHGHGCSGEAKYRDLQPILLTGELLLLCGFIKSQQQPETYYLSNEAGWMFSKYASYPCELWSMDKRTDVKYNFLHELQNLFFRLTQQELTVNL